MFFPLSLSYKYIVEPAVIEIRTHPFSNHHIKRLPSSITDWPTPNSEHPRLQAMQLQMNAVETLEGESEANGAPIMQPFENIIEEFRRESGKRGLAFDVGLVGC
jgi:hypothetical protein